MIDNAEHVRASLSVDPQAGGAGPSPSETPPFCIVVLGDFSARAHRPGAPAPPLAERRPFEVRAPEDVLERLRPTLDLHLEGPGRVRVEVRALEDLHPDRLVENVPHLQRLLAAIEPAVAGHGEAEDGPSSGERAESTGEASAPSADTPPSGLLDEIVEAAPRAPERAPSSSIPELEPWIRSVVGPHLVDRETEGQEALRVRLQREAADQVRRVLEAEPVRRYEGLLRSLLLLLASAEPSSGVRVHVLDVTRDELEADLASGLEASALLRVLASPLDGPCSASAPALLVGAWTFGSAVPDVALLNRIAMLAHVVESAWVSSAGLSLLGVTEWNDLSDPFPEVEDPSGLWRALRETGAAAALGLVAPPFLARLPYGAETDPCDLEGFQEVPPGETRPGPQRYVWGEPAFLCAAALAASFARRGWELAVEGPADFPARPLHALGDGTVGAHPLLAPWTADAAEQVRGRGVMPLVVYRGEARVRLSWIGSIAAPRGPLGAWWSTR